ncbi:MAG TPA: hypothetical protein VH088_17065 [Terriglobales bacterium]|nr:hypothetical protein [Terriglobales bacterium]
MATKQNTTNSNGSTTIKVNVNLEESPNGEQLPKISAYAFTANGRFIGKAAVDEKGNASLKVPATRNRQEVRIVAGPETTEESPSLQSLLRRGATTSYVEFGADAKLSPVVFQLASEIWRCWFRRCAVKGQLLKRIYSSGVAIDYPVWGADVQIWEVESILYVISKLADVHLKAISEYMLNPQPLPPGPGPDPGPESLARFGKLEVAQPMSTVKEFTAASPEFDELHAAAMAGDLVNLRQAMVSLHEPAARFLICRLFPYLIQKWQVGTLTTDRCGRFNGFVFLGCNEAANLYFTATERFILSDITIYAPQPVRCYTHWNYQCGTEITLYTNSPCAHLCFPCQQVDAPENYVLIRALGNIALSGIYGTSTSLSGSTTPGNIGQAANLYGAGLDAPFGGTVLPRFEFDSTLREFNLAKYYRVRYRPGTTGAFTELQGEIARKYNHWVGTTLLTSPYLLGPNLVNGVSNLFEIPPALPPAGDWAFPNPPVDLANAQIPTSDLLPDGIRPTHGKYQLEVTLFDQNGIEVNIAGKGIRYFVPTTEDPDGTIHTADASSLPGLVVGNSFIMTVHVDNRPTSGSLDAPTLNGAAPDACGVFRYGAGPSGTVTIPFTASHPDNFAIYSYRLVRNATPLTPPTSSGKVSAATNPANIVMSVAGLLTQPDGTICAIAGFSEDLYVTSLATDGWNRVAYDSGLYQRAFVLAPQPHHP